MLTSGHVAQALHDPRFREAFPEFAQLRVETPVKKVGCASCRERRAVRSLTADFLNKIPQLRGERLAALKAYFGVEGLMVYVRNENGGVSLKVF